MIGHNDTVGGSRMVLRIQQLLTESPFLMVLIGRMTFRID